MKKKLLIPLLLIVNTLYAQLSLKGKIVDEFNNPIPFVNVFFKNTTIGVTTNDDGSFSLKTEQQQALLEISFVGFKTQTIKVNRNTKFLNIILKEDTNELEEVIIVGVYNYGAKSRWFDFTPTKADKFTQTLEVTARDFPTGGSEQFYAFIVSELMPKINTEYRTDNKKNVLYGHSLGGLFCLSTLQKESSPFTHYLLSSPSIWWNDREIFENPLPKRAFEPVVYLTVGEMEQIPTNLPAEIIKLFPKEVIINDGNARMTEGITDAYDYLKAQKNVEVYAHIEEGEVHMSSNIPSFSRGIRTLLNGNNRDELRRRSSERPTLPW